jgi:hypothetical protein
MKKTIFKLSCIASTAFLLSACGAGTYMHDKMSELTMQKKLRADGSTLSMYINVAPTESWGCKDVGEPQSFNWLKLKTESQFHFKTGEAYLMDKAVNYADAQHLKANYANLTIPTENTFTTGNSKVTTSHYRHGAGQAVIEYYQCKLINPEKRVGSEIKNDVSLKIGN